jgi:hypothetical protein
VCAARVRAGPLRALPSSVLRVHVVTSTLACMRRNVQGWTCVGRDRAAVPGGALLTPQLLVVAAHACINVCCALGTQKAAPGVHTQHNAVTCTHALLRLRYKRHAPDVPSLTRDRAHTHKQSVTQAGTHACRQAGVDLHPNEHPQAGFHWPDTPLIHRHMHVAASAVRAARCHAQLQGRAIDTSRDEGSYRPQGSRHAWRRQHTPPA